MLAAFRRTGPSAPETPILVSVPHAGRRYPEEIKDLARLPLSALTALEDRHADALASELGALGHSAVIAETPRAWIDLNRAEDEIDGTILEPDARHLAARQPSLKVRGGLGLIPARIANGGLIWRDLIDRAHLLTRIEHHYRPYHRAIADELTARIARFGCAVLLDLHSMPPPKPASESSCERLVLGDLFGRACHPRFGERLISEAEDAGYAIGRNAPYAGGHILERHALPHRGVHALQLEIDRSLYLDAALDQPGPGCGAITRFVGRIADALCDEALSQPMALAAE